MKSKRVKNDEYLYSTFQLPIPSDTPVKFKQEHNLRKAVFKKRNFKVYGRVEGRDSFDKIMKSLKLAKKHNESIIRQYEFGETSRNQETVDEESEEEEEDEEEEVTEISQELKMEDTPPRIQENEEFEKRSVIPESKVLEKGKVEEEPECRGKKWIKLSETPVFVAIDIPKNYLPSEYFENEGKTEEEEEEEEGLLALKSTTADGTSELFRNCLRMMSKTYVSNQIKDNIVPWGSKGVGELFNDFEIMRGFDERESKELEKLKKAKLSMDLEFIRSVLRFTEMSYEKIETFIQTLEKEKLLEVLSMVNSDATMIEKKDFIIKYADNEFKVIRK